MKGYIHSASHYQFTPKHTHTAACRSKPGSLAHDTFVITDFNYLWILFNNNISAPWGPILHVTLMAHHNVFFSFATVAACTACATCRSPITIKQLFVFLADEKTIAFIMRKFCVGACTDVWCPQRLTVFMSRWLPWCSAAHLYSDSYTLNQKKLAKFIHALYFDTPQIHICLYFRC